MNMHAPPAGAKSKSNVGPARFGTILMALAIGAALGAFAYRFSASPWGGSQPVPGSGESVPQLVHEGQQIIVPDGSPLRGKLTIDAIAAREVQRNLVLPAVVEADPARLVRVLPPLAGRITQLKVQLGEQVERGQPLVVLNSADLDTAYADYDRAKLLLALATKTRERMRGLGRAGGIAEKDIQQAETDFLTADAEFQR